MWRLVVGWRWRWRWRCRCRLRRVVCCGGSGG